MDFKTAINTFGRQLDGQIIHKDGTLTGEELVSIKPRFNAELFKTVMEVLEFETETYIDSKQWISAKIGVLIGDIYEYKDYGLFYITKEPEYLVDTKSYKYEAYSKMVESMIPHDDNPLEITYPITLKNFLITVCNKLNWDYDLDEPFPNQDSLIESDLYSGLGMTYRDILDDVSPLTGGNFINRETFVILYPEDTGDVLNDDYLNEDNITIHETIIPINALVFSRSDVEDNLHRRDEEAISENGLSELKFNDNLILSSEYRENFIDELWNFLRGFSYTPFDIKTTGTLWFNTLDKFTINHDGIDYETILLNYEIEYENGINEIMYSDALEEIETDYKTSAVSDKAQKIANRITYKNEAKIVDITQDITENTSKITTLTQTAEGLTLEVSELNTDVNSLSNKTNQLTIDVNQLRNEIGDVTDITTQEEGQGTLNFESINASEPINMTIRGTVNGDVDLLYPYNVLYPQSTLYPKTRVLRFINTATSEIIDYEIPIDLYYLDAETYDEYTWDFASGVCQTVKKITLDASGDKTVLPAPVTIVHDAPGIYLDDGDYTITTLGQPYAYMKIRLMSQNMYTSQFATRVELTSAINQSASEINLEVAKKVGNDEVISRINQTAEAIKIEASKIDIQGTLTAINNDTSTTINGNKITTGSITASQVSSAIITTSNFSAQNINASRITTGTMTAGAINLGNGTFRVTTGGAVTATSGSIGGWNLTSSGITSGITDSQIYPNGRLRITPSTGGRLNAGSEGFLINGDGGSRPVVISDFITQTPGSGASIGMRAIYGNIRIASSYRASLIGNGDSEVFCDYGIMLNSGGTGKNIYASRVGSTASANMVVTTGGGNPSSKNTKKDFKEITDYEKIYEEFKDLKLYDFKYKYKDISTKENGFGFIIDDLEETKTLSRYLTTYDRYGKIEGNNFIETLPEESKFEYKTWDRDDTIQMLFILSKSLQNKIDKLEEQLNEKS